MADNLKDSLHFIDLEEAILKNLISLDQWFDFVAEVFTLTPRSYFVNHWNNDTHKNPKAVFVALDSNTIVGTVKVYERTMYLGGNEVSVGGIGEVSTKITHRKMKIASRLLKMAIKFMLANNISISSLHTGSAAPVYESLGWITVPRLLIKKDISSYRKLTPQKSLHLSVQPATWDIRELLSMKKIYDSYSRQFNGTFVRNSDDYWNNWIRTESMHSLVALDGGELVAYMLFGAKKNISKYLLIKDFAVNETYRAISFGRNVFDLLLHAALDTFLSSPTNSFTTFIYPAALFHEIIHDDAEGIELETEEGTMYRRITEKNIDTGEITEETKALAQNITAESAHNGVSHHVFWNIDSY